jgi:Flp pilus assembly protein TadG
VKRSKKSASKRGVAAVEMALVLPVFITLVFGLIEATQFAMACQELTTAAREGCRVAVLDGKVQADVQSRISTVLSGSGISVGTVTPTCPSPYSWDSAPAGTAITVSLSVPFSQVSWLPTPFFLKGASVSAAATMSSQRP